MLSFDLGGYDIHTAGHVSAGDAWHKDTEYFFEKI